MGFGLSDIGLNVFRPEWYWPKCLVTGVGFGPSAVGPNGLAHVILDQMCFGPSCIGPNGYRTQVALAQISLTQKALAQRGFGLSGIDLNGFRP